MNTEILIEKLMENHTKYNQEVDNYQENGEEEFNIWLAYEIKKMEVKE